MKTVDREKLWGEYQKNPSSALREKLITEYAPVSYTHLNRRMKEWNDDNS